MNANQSAARAVVSGTYTKFTNTLTREEVKCGIRTTAGCSRGSSSRTETHYVLTVHLKTDVLIMAWHIARVGGCIASVLLGTCGRSSSS